MYEGGYESELPEQYRPGGFHPILLGDVFKNGRYKVIQKIGWGGFATIWVARDQLHHRNVALKVHIAKKNSNSEILVSNAITKLSKEYPGQDHPGQHHLVPLLDHFTVVGPNGTHDCLVLELLGPSVSEVAERFGRLPPDIAKSTAYQALLGIDFLSRQKIAHGDLHTNNIAFALPNLASLDESQFYKKFGRPKTLPLRRLDGKALTARVPKYTVEPISFFDLDGLREELRTCTVKIIDFGEAFFRSQSAAAVNTPLTLRPPEAIFDDWVDYRVDRWSMGCLFYEIMAGLPPLTSFSPTRKDIVEDMMRCCSDELPLRWQRKFHAVGLSELKPIKYDPDKPKALPLWLVKDYVNLREVPVFTRHDIVRVGELITRMLKFEPASRATAEETLSDGWFGEMSGVLSHRVSERGN
ncbi:kinase-like protein [Nemania serpens]|nr:kinase-like protein [Nemania serpens]